MCSEGKERKLEQQAGVGCSRWTHKQGGVSLTANVCDVSATAAEAHTRLIDVNSHPPPPPPRLHRVKIYSLALNLRTSSSVHGTTMSWVEQHGGGVTPRVHSPVFWTGRVIWSVRREA